MNHNVLMIAGILCVAATILSGQPDSGSRIFTAAQADAGRVAYDKTCGRCHTLTLMGREGKPDERPELHLLSEADRKFIADYGGRVPPLAGKVFLERWGSKTAAQLIARFQEAKFSFKAAGLTDEEDIVHITAYVLQVNGAKAGSQRLTRASGAVVNTLFE